jgi:hypothetical protein
MLSGLDGLLRGGSTAVLGIGAATCLCGLFGICRARKMASEKRMASTLAAAVRGDMFPATIRNTFAAR